MRKTIIFILIAIVVLGAGSWITSTAYGHTNDTTGLNAATTDDNIYVTPAPLEDIPVVEFFGNYIGSVHAGDLFYVTANESQLDISVNLYITNTDELVKSLRYFIVKIGIYVEGANGQWLKVTTIFSVAIPDTYITLENGTVNFMLPGMANYKFTIESGSYKSFPTTGNDITPQFYMEAEAA